MNSSGQRLRTVGKGGRRRDSQFAGRFATRISRGGPSPLMADVLTIIPARLSATRLPGKPLADIAGTPMVVHVLRRAEAANLGPVVVATDALEIGEVVQKAGGRAVM